MKLSVVFLMSCILAGCSAFTEQQIVQEHYFVPVIRSDVAPAGYTPAVTPTITHKESRLIYTPAID
ncbi:hypothetical protein ACUM5Y_13175 [Marinomonas dokdonensis]|uniref:hypothetical protein n=1 Tax=Marinomonas dokdonensis TaxID=328224 RepID=UPI0040555608